MSGKSFMYGHGESYRGIVPAKQPNKGGRPPAEAVEGRPLTKENARQSRPCQTPCWVSGPSELERACVSLGREGCHSSASAIPRHHPR
jgi:hypothetical protein